jgi:aminopeptidase 2
MGATEDPNLAEETLQFTLLTARTQDLLRFFFGLRANPRTRRLLAQFFEDNYDAVRFVHGHLWITAYHECCE